MLRTNRSLLRRSLVGSLLLTVGLGLGGCVWHDGHHSRGRGWGWDDDWDGPRHHHRNRHWDGDRDGRGRHDFYGPRRAPGRNWR
jgi:hypothetical protein